MIGIIGGSGLDDSTLFDSARDTSVETPYGRLPVFCGRDTLPE